VRGQRRENDSQQGNDVRYAAAAGTQQETLAVVVEAECRLATFVVKEPRLPASRPLLLRLWSESYTGR
jgi:hypothetical protein